MRTIVAILVASALWLGPFLGSARCQVLLPRLPGEPRALSAEEQKQAKMLFERADKASRKGRLERALQPAGELYELKPTARNALILGMLLGALERHEEALEFYLIAWHLEPNDEDRDAVRQGLEKTSAAAGFGFLEVGVAPASAAVTVAGQRLPAGVKRVALKVGSHAMAAEAPGFTATKTHVRVTKGRVTQISLELTKKAEPPPPEPPEKPPEPQEEPPEPASGSDLEVPGWVLTATGGALVIGGAVFFGLAAGTSSDLDEVPPGDNAGYRDLEGSMGMQQSLAWVLTGVGVAALVTGVVLLALEPAAEDQTTLTAPALVPLRDGAALSASWRF